MEYLLEREAKFDVDDEFALPGLGELLPGREVTHDTVDLISEYYDTPQRDLRAHDLLLRRRTGDDDSGWQLKVPVADGREELRWPLTDSPPDEVIALLKGVRLGKRVDKVGTIHTVRSRYRTFDGDELFAELADDYVRAWTDDKLLAWRELELELGPRASAFPESVLKALRDAGARKPRHASKLAHLLPQRSVWVRKPANGATAVTRYVDEQLDAIVAGDLGLRRGQDPIHDTRVATRRLRSSLRVFGPLFDPAAIEGVDEELKWFAGLLGDVRDSQVQQRRFGDALDELPDELILGPVRTRVRNDLQAVELPARVAVREAMDSPRYLALMTVLREWRSTPPVDPRVDVGAVSRRVRKSERKADRRLGAALADGDAAQLHRARKACKRARYAAELSRGLGGSKRTVKRYKKFQSVLGDHQDTVVASDVLRRMGGAAGTADGENGFTFGMLYAREQQIADECRREAMQLM